MTTLPTDTDFREYIDNHCGDQSCGCYPMDAVALVSDAWGVLLPPKDHGYSWIAILHKHAPYAHRAIKAAKCTS